MIPDFLQNPGGLQKPTGPSGNAEPLQPTDADSTASDFTRALRGQQTSRSDGRRPSSDATDRASRQSEPSSAPSASELEPASRAESSNDASRTSISERPDAIAENRPAQGSSDGNSVGRTEEQSKQAPLGNDAVDPPTERQQGETQDLAADRIRGDVDSDAASRKLTGSSSDAESADKNGLILVDGFLTEVGATTATDDGLQLDVDDAADTADETTVDDEAQLPVVELQPGQNGEAGQPFVLSSLVSIAVAESALQRRQQAEAGQGDAQQDSAEEPVVLRLPERSSTATPDDQVALDGPPADETAMKASVENPVLRSLAVARAGHRVGRSVQGAISQNAATDTVVENQTDAPPRSELTPQTLTVDQTTVRSSAAGTPGEEVAVADSGVAQAPADAAEVSSGESRSQTVGNDVEADVVSEVSIDGYAEGPDSATPDRSQRNVRQQVDRVASADEGRLAAGGRSADSREAAPQLNSQEAGHATDPAEGDRQAVSEPETAGDAVSRRTVEAGEQPRNATGSQRDAQERQQRGRVSGPAASEATVGAASDEAAESSIGPSVTTSREPSDTRGAARATSTGRVRVETQRGPTDVKPDEEVAASGTADFVDGPSSNVASAEGRPVSGTSPVGTASAQTAIGETGQVSHAAVPVATSEQAGGSSTTRFGSEATPAATSASAVSTSDSMPNPVSGEADSPVIGGPDRFLSPNVQRALSAIRSAAEGGSRLRVQLNPVELGALLVEIEQTPQGIVARLEVGNAAAHSMLVDSLSDLQQSLSRSQSAVDRIDVVLTEARTETSRQQREQGQQRDQPEQRGQQQRGDAESERRRQRDDRATASSESDSESGEPRAEAA
jgi:hypothetical protein